MKNHRKISAPPPRRPRGLTFVELMTTLIIFALVSSAATSLLLASSNTQSYVLKNSSTMSQTELAFRRIVENVRSASQASAPSSTEIDVVTEPDTSKAGNPVYNIQYTLVGSLLVENDDRFGSNILASNVTAFTVSTLQATKPTMYQVTLSVKSQDGTTITRQACVTSRNF